MPKVTITLRKGRRPDSPRSLCAVLRLGSEKIRISLGVSVEQSKWDPRKERVLGRGKAVDDTNLIISNAKAKITEILVRARLLNQELTREVFMAQYRCPGSAGSFFGYVVRYDERVKDSLQWETRRHHAAAIRKLKEYAPGLRLEDVTHEFLNKYAVYLRDELHNVSGTVRKNLSVICVYIKAALRDGLLRSDPFAMYKLPRAQPVRVFLVEDELRRLLQLYTEEVLPENEQDVLRFFLFMTFTGMHISDARSLQIAQIYDGEIHYQRMKTRINVSVPLSSPALKLVEYYRAKRFRGPLFVKLPTDQAFNRTIKRICERVGITKAVSAKAARHTFATLYYKKNGGDLGTLAKLLGHNSINSTMVYAHITNDLRRAGVSAFDGML